MRKLSSAGSLAPGSPAAMSCKHRDGDRIAGAIVDKPADVWVVFDAIEVDFMAVSGEHRLQDAEVEAGGSACLGDNQRIVG